jgi:hypothetical protein
MQKLFASLILFLLIFIKWSGPISAMANDQRSDLGFVVANFRFSNSPLIAGESVRFYVTVKNFGNVDSTGYVTMYLSGTIVNTSIPVKVVNGGYFDEVWFDFVVPSNKFNLSLELQNVSPLDVNLANNRYLSPMYEPLVDSDKDGVYDNVDNCQYDVNPDQRDSNGNGIGDVCDLAWQEVSRSESNVSSDSTSPVMPNVNTPSVIKEVTPVINSVQVPANSAITTNSVDIQLSGDNEVIKGETDILDSSVISEPSFLAGSPLTASFNIERLHWNTYRFSSYTKNEGANYTWEFSDGSVLSGHHVDHVFPKDGNYTVTLTVALNDGTFKSSTRNVGISIFHLDNIWFSGTLLISIVLIAVIFIYFFKGKRL